MKATLPVIDAAPGRSLPALHRLMELCQRLVNRPHTFPAAFGASMYREFRDVLRAAEDELSGALEAATDGRE